MKANVQKLRVTLLTRKQRQKDELIGYTKAVTNLLHLRKFATLICDTRRLFIEKCGGRRLKSGGGDF